MLNHYLVNIQIVLSSLIAHANLEFEHEEKDFIIKNIYEATVAVRYTYSNVKVNTTVEF